MIGFTSEEKNSSLVEKREKTLTTYTFVNGKNFLQTSIYPRTCLFSSRWSTPVAQGRRNSSDLLLWRGFPGCCYHKVEILNLGVVDILG